MPARLLSSSLKRLCPGSGTPSRSGGEKRTPCLSLDFVKAGLRYYLARLRLLSEGVKSGCSFPFWPSHRSVQSNGIRLPGPRLRGFLSQVPRSRRPPRPAASASATAARCSRPLPGSAAAEGGGGRGTGTGTVRRAGGGQSGWAPTAGRQPGGKKG